MNQMDFNYADLKEIELSLLRSRLREIEQESRRLVELQRRLEEAAKTKSEIKKHLVSLFFLR